MSKKMLFLISLALVLGLATNASAQWVNWDNGGPGNLWNTPNNWDPCGVPDSSQNARLWLPEIANKCVIDSTHIDANAATCKNFMIGHLAEGGHL